jgi:hypothetical protein
MLIIFIAFYLLGTDILAWQGLGIAQSHGQ